MNLTKIDKEIFADKVLKIMQDAREEIDDAGSEHRRTCAKLTAYEEYVVNFVCSARKSGLQVRWMNDRK